MDALILSCGTGGGHDAAGRAVLEALRAGGHNAVMRNPYTLQSSHFAGAIDKTYIAAARSAPRAFGAVYKIGDLYRRLPFRSPVYFANHAMVCAMQRYLERNHFDIIIMPHLFPAEILTNMRQHGIPVPKTIFVATDYVCIPFTEETQCDAYVIPAPDLTRDFVQRGIPKEKLHPLGIPTGSDFSQALTREQARQRLGLHPDERYILVTGGSMGGGQMNRTIDALLARLARRKDTRLIVVCGSNRALYDRLRTQCGPAVTVIGHTDQMAAYLKAADLFITKPGGLSSTEAAVCEVPILHTSPIPGCEDNNARYFSQRGMSVFCQPGEEMVCAVSRLLDSPEAAQYMKDCQRRYIPKDAATRICRLAETMTVR